MNEGYIANAERRRRIAEDMAWSSGYAAGRAAERAATPQPDPVERRLDIEGNGTYTAYVDGRACHLCGLEPYRHKCPAATPQPDPVHPHDGRDHPDCLCPCCINARTLAAIVANAAPYIAALTPTTEEAQP